MTTTNITLTADDVTDMIDSVDAAFKGMVRDYDAFNDLPGTNSVYRIGDWGWIWEYQWDTVFAE